MTSECIERISMACFVEGIDLASLALGPHHIAQGEAFLAEILRESDTDAYCRCMEALLGEREAKS